MATALLMLATASMVTAAANIYTVWGSVIYNRAGEIQPDAQGAGLTSIGAQQAYASGQYWRSRYLTGDTTIRNIDPNLLDPDQLYVAALDTRGTVASAQAFAQGLYPPFEINNASNSFLDPSSITSNGSYIETPLNGYQYPQISVANAVDAEYVFLGGNLLCPAFDLAMNDIKTSTAYQAASAYSAIDYTAVKRILTNITTSSWDFDHAYSAYRAISYLDMHDSQTHATLQQARQPNTNRSYVDVFRDYAAQQQQFRLTNMSTLNQFTQSRSLPYTGGSISTIAGNMLASKLLVMMQLNLETMGAQYKLSVLFGSIEPIISLTALLGIDNGTFLGLPEQASAMAFELYSYENSTNSSYPSYDNLRVAFKFRNGTASGTALTSPPLVDMTWDVFQKTLTYLSLGGVGDWCQQCGSNQLFCAAWNVGAVTSVGGTSTSAGQGMAPVAAGAVGAIVALFVAALIFMLVMLLGRFRFYRKPAKSEMGGFKGSAKLASDPDLVHGAATEASDRRPGLEGHERTGSWELRAKESKPYAPRASMEHDPAMDPFADPVRAHEHV